MSGAAGGPFPDTGETNRLMDLANPKGAKQSPGLDCLCSRLWTLRSRLLPLLNPLIRIFIPLAVLATMLLVGNLIFGLWFGDLNTPVSECRTIGEEILDLNQLYPMPTAKIAELEQRKKSLLNELGPVQERSTVHIMLGVLAALMTALVSSIAITYHIGTSRWCKEVVQAYSLDEALVRRSNRLKRNTWPWALVTMAAILSIIVLGGASWPVRPGTNTAMWVKPHMFTAMVGVYVIAVAFRRQALNILANHAVIQEIVGEVRRIRLERGLEVD